MSSQEIFTHTHTHTHTHTDTHTHTHTDTHTHTHTHNTIGEKRWFLQAKVGSRFSGLPLREVPYGLYKDAVVVEVECAASGPMTEMSCLLASCSSEQLERSCVRF